MCIDYWSDDCHLLWTLKSNATSYNQWFENNFDFFKQSLLYVSFEWHQSKTYIESFFKQFLFHKFLCKFYFSRYITLNFLSWNSDFYSYLSVSFSFLTNRLFLYLHRILHHSWMERLTSFVNLSSVDCLLEWILCSFSLFQLAVLLLESWFLLIKYGQPLAKGVENCL